MQRLQHAQCGPFNHAVVDGLRFATRRDDIQFAQHRQML